MCLSLAADGDTKWSSDGVQLDTATSPHTVGNSVVIPDGNGGAIFVWEDVTDLTPSTYSGQLRAQRIDSTGNKLWGTNGVLVSIKSTSQWPAITSDGAGGAIVAWIEGRQDASGYAVYAQRLGPNGSGQWASDVQISSTFGAFSTLTVDLSPVICTDRLGGAFIGWGARLAYVDSSGSLPAPGINGLLLIPGGTDRFKLISDKPRGWNPITPSAGGAFAAWTGNGKIYAQHISAGLAWGAAGVEVATDTVGYLAIAHDSADGLLLAWGTTEWVNSAIHAQIKCQRLDSNGTKLWAAGGVVVIDSTTVGGSWPVGGAALDVTTDQSGGAILAWVDYRTVPTYPWDPDLYAQRVDETGQLRWKQNGVLLPPYIVSGRAPGTQGEPRIVSDGHEGAVVAYQDKGGWGWDIAATRLNRNGQKLWSKWVKFDGTSFASPGNSQTSPALVLDDPVSALGGIFLAWQDSDGAGHHKVFAQKVEIGHSRLLKDFNGDGQTDILWRHKTSGTLVAWLMNGSNLSDWKVSSPTINDPLWKVVGTGDFNGDGTADILWQHKTIGLVVAWLMNGTDMGSFKIVLPLIADLEWEIVGVGDFNGDGSADILWRHAKNGDVVVWPMNGTDMASFKGVQPVIEDMQWKVVGGGDFNGDGNADILWRHDGLGVLVAWNMYRGNMSDWKVVTPYIADTQWEVVGAEDFNGDGSADILWRHSTLGVVVVWLMNGTDLGSWQVVLPYIADLEWEICGPK
jgi:hypothetical protein